MKIAPLHKLDLLSELEQLHDYELCDKVRLHEINDLKRNTVLRNFASYDDMWKAHDFLDASFVVIFEQNGNEVYFKKELDNKQSKYDLSFASILNYMFTSQLISKDTDARCIAAAFENYAITYPQFIKCISLLDKLKNKNSSTEILVFENGSSVEFKSGDVFKTINGVGYELGIMIES